MNQKEPVYIEELVHKFRAGNIDQNELTILLDWYNAHDDRYTEIFTATPDQGNAIKTRMLEQLIARVRQDSVEKSDRPREVNPTELHPPARTMRVRWAIAAAIAVFAVVAGWATIQYFGSENAEQLSALDTTIAPGGNRATLILPDGREIVLSTDQQGIVVGEGVSYRDGTLLGDAQFDGRDGNGLHVGQLVMQTPRGGTYQVTLPDGTEVWLNAASTLTYPSSFDEAQRKVEVIGEAYFVVRPAYRSDGSKIPFTVSSRHQEIEVLGTEFNISAYSDQPLSKTTLIEGQIRLKDGNNEFLLKPGEQAATGTANTTVHQVNISTFTAWRDGRFSFDGKPFAEVMNEIGQWYDLDIVYQGTPPDEELVGDAFRNQNLGLVLRVLDVAEINYDIDVPNRKLIIMDTNQKPKR